MSILQRRGSAAQLLQEVGGNEGGRPSLHRASSTALRKSLIGGASGGLQVATRPEFPDLGLEPINYEMRWGEVLGKGASGATVVEGSMFVDGTVGSGHFAKGVCSEVPFAAKVLPLTTGTWSDMVEDLGREITIMQGLKHPALVTFLGAGKIICPPVLGLGDAQAYALCMELCDLTLENAMHQRRQDAVPFAGDEMGPALSQVTSGLRYLHQQNVLHRDLKSANVFLKCRVLVDDEKAFASQPLSAFLVKLGDFGGCAASLRAETPCQTPQWMAPEAMRLEGYGPASDIWSLGMLMYELLELDVPYGEEITMPQLEDALTAGRAPELSKEKGAEERAPAIVELMNRCLKLDPDERPTATALCIMFATADKPASRSDWLLQRASAQPRLGLQAVSGSQVGHGLPTLQYDQVGQYLALPPDSPGIGSIARDLAMPMLQAADYGSPQQNAQLG